MVANAKELNSMPVLGFEWSGCYYNDQDDGLWTRNALKAAGCIPVVNLVAGVIIIALGVMTLSKTSEEVLNEHGIELSSLALATILHLHFKLKNN